MNITDMYTSSISDASRTFRDYIMSEISFHNILYTLKLSIIYELYSTINIITPSETALRQKISDLMPL